MARMRLRFNHDMMVRFNELCDHADRLGIRIVPVASGGIELIDTRNDTCYELRDVEDYGGPGTFHVEVPPLMECKLITETGED